MTKDLSSNLVYDLSLSYQKTAALKAAIKLGVFSAIGGGRLSANELSGKTGASERGLRMLCDFLCVIGLMEKDTEGYILSTDARRLLDGNSPSCMADIIDFYAAPEMVSQVMNDPEAYVRNGGAAGMANVSPDNPIWIKFAQAMIPFASVTAKRTAAYITRRNMKPRRILDVAAGHGLYGIEAAKVSDQASVTAMDWPNVLEVAKKNARQTGIGNRYRTLGGNAFEMDWGEKYDLILMANLLHHFDPDGCICLLAKAKRFLNENGSLMVIDMIPNPDRVSPPEPAAFALLMLATTPRGDAYLEEEYKAMASKAGLSLVETRALLPTPQTLMEFRI